MRKARISAGRRPSSFRLDIRTPHKHQSDRLNLRYIGSTNDLRKRLVFHRRRLIPGFTRKYNVHRLIYFEELPDMGAARERERRLKGLNRAKKDALVYAVNPELRDLSDEIPGRPSDV